MDFSFIIPAFNEAENIVNVIRSIDKHVPSVYKYEIIVVDHGSADDTIKLAEVAGAKVLKHREGTVAGLRNFGVTHSKGKVIVFLDADILLTRVWQKNINEVFTQLSSGARILTGSWCSVPEDPGWIENFWFKPLERGDNSHINSGHLIISRLLFDEIKGFDEKLETGEDYDISMRARAASIGLVDNVSLKVVHEGYPKSLSEFVKREYWHGKGDVTSLMALFHSKVAMVALMFVGLHLGLIYFSFAQCEVWVYALVVGVACIVIGVSCLKYKEEAIQTILVNSFIYYVYFWARGLSAISLLGNKNIRKRTR